MKKALLLLIIVVSFYTSCKQSDTTSKGATPAVEAKGIADDESEEIVAASIKAMGGQQAYDAINVLSWTFFGARHLVWDKKNNRVRIDSPRDSSVYLLDMNTMEGVYAKNGEVEKDSTVIKDKMERAKSIWINDSYWLVMPWKLRDAGVTIKYLRQDTLADQKMADVIEMTFDNVGETPENKYEVFVDQSDHMIKRWAFYKDANQAKASRVWPWDNYQLIDGIQISFDRSDKSGPSNVRTYDALDDKVFESVEPFDYF